MTMEELTEFYGDKRILVISHTGFKGAWLPRTLALAGAKMTGYALEPPTDPNLFEITSLGDTMESVIKGARDLKHLRDVSEQMEPEIVFHLATQPIMRDSYKDPVHTYETNVTGTVHVIECVWLTKSICSLLSMTTDKVYENKEWEYGYRENDPLDGFDPYSNSKSCSELVTYSYQKSFLPQGCCAVSTSRAGNVIGGSDLASDRIVPDCVRAAIASKDIIVRNPHSTRPYRLVLGPLAVYLTIAIEQYEDQRYQGYYNVGPDDKDCVTIGHLMGMFYRVWGQRIKWIGRYGEDPHETGFLKLDCSRIKSVFGWQPRCGVEETTAKTMEWSRAYLGGEKMLEVMDRQVRESFTREN